MYTMDEKTLRDLLFRAGWSTDGGDGKDLVADYQRFHGLKVDGMAGPVTERTLTQRFCSVPDNARRRGGSPPKWNKRELALKISGNLPGISDGAFREAALSAFGQWSKVCNLKFHFGDNPDILITTGRIDGPSKTLGWSELPPGDDRRLTQKYDDAEPWVISINPPSSKIGLLHVLGHEAGHAIGLDHGPTGDWMQPYYDPRIYTPQAGDIRRSAELYGPPVVNPDPDPVDPVDPPGDGLTIFIPGARVLT